MNQIVSFTNDIEVAKQLASGFRADNTFRVYQTSVAQFTDYCRANGLASLPASPETVCAFIASLARDGKKIGTIKARVSAIKWFHKAAGEISPTTDASIEMVLAGLSRKIGVAPKQATPMLARTVKTVVDAILEGDKCADRDRALLLLAFFGGFRRSELSSIRVEHLDICDQGLTVFLPSSKTDQVGEGRYVAIARQHNAYCPVKAVEAMMGSDGRLFPISDRMVHKIIVKLCGRAGVDEGQFSPHSLRAGMVTQAAMNKVAKSDIRRITGHKSDAMIDHYTRIVDQWENNATRGMMG